jgi:HSP20 family protein
VSQQLPVSVTDPASTLKANVYDEPGGDAYVVEVPVPGIRAEDIVIEVSVETITVKTRYSQREQTLRSLSRVFEFPMALDTDNVRATLEHGVLRIRAPKAIAGRQRVIRVGQAA